MDTIANQRYQSVRHQLDQLHYNQPFSKQQVKTFISKNRNLRQQILTINIDIESCALVERLITDLTKTTEAYQKVKNELSIITNENKLNQQALVPLQKENERLCKENNLLHFDVIKAKEDLEQLDLKWKSSVRQLQNECQDLRFLVDQKDIKIKKQDQELTKMKGKYEKILAKTYVSTQDEVVDGLNPDLYQREETNLMVKGQNQKFEMNAPLGKTANELSQLVNEESYHHNQQENQFRTQSSGPVQDFIQAKKWVDELTKSDERCQQYLSQLDEANLRRREVEDRLQGFEKQLTMRDEEIKRLHSLYEGGQNLERLNIRYVHETNEKTIAKLQNQVEFLNKENHRYQQQLDFLKGGRSAVDEVSALRNQISDLTFENQTLRKDSHELTKLLKDLQEKEVQSKQREKTFAESERERAAEVEKKLREVSIEHDKLRVEYEKVRSVKGAYNADKKVFFDRIQELEDLVKAKESERKEVEHRYQLLDQTTQQYRNEINFWNGKFSTIKRDIEYQDKFMQKYQEENTRLAQENEYLKTRLDQNDRDSMLLKKQLNGLQEDNDRINRMYQVVEKEAFTSSVYVKQHYAASEYPNQDPTQQKRLTATPKAISRDEKASQPVSSSKWKVVEDDFGPSTVNFGTQKLQPPKQADENNVNQITVKRSQY